MALKPRTARIESLDALRGLAVLGILMVNVQTFAMTRYAMTNPALEADFGPEGQAVWRAIVIGFQLKFITIFSALFGAGIVLMAGEGEDRDRERLHVRRMAWLLAIGMIHAYVVWYGDILVPYAVAGLVLTEARRWRARRLAIVGALLIAAAGLIYLGSIRALGFASEEALKAAAETWAPSPETLAAELELYRSSLFARWPETAAFAAEVQVNQIIGFGARIVGVMMVGMALQKKGFFAAEWPLAAYAGLALLAPLGAWGSAWSADLQIAAGFDMVEATPGYSVLFVASLVQALGYAAVVMLACRAPQLRILRAPFAAAGRMALTNYLACSLVGALVFYGPPGLAKIGQLSRTEQLGFVFAVWAGILAVSPLWLAVFRFGPVEWAWRSLTYRSRPALRRRSASGE